MKSLFTVFACFAFLAAFRFAAPHEPLSEVKVATWDALGYYYYVPGVFIYKDIKKLDWLFEANEKYNLTPKVYQANLHENGNYVGKYFVGLSFLHLPFFLAAHAVVPLTDFPADGFSFPYQLAIMIGALFYALAGLLILRKVLLRYFSDGAAAITLAAVALGTNFAIYAAMDSGMIHVYIFFLFCLQLLAVAKWYEQPRWYWALLIGLLVGFATCCRPTEAVMLFLPLLWGEFDKASAKKKWRMVGQNKSHILWAVLGGLAGILPQFAYWRHTADSFIYNVGSKWVFFDPWWRVLFGWEKGWFVYTPIVLFFVLGLFFLKNQPFKRAVIVFFVLNTWIIIAWFDWRYGGSYSTRALVQSYPVLALPMAAFVQRFLDTKWRWLLFSVFSLLVALNIFQLFQYRNGVIHYDHMNRRYYQAVFLNPSPSPEQFSLLDTDEFPAKKIRTNETLFLRQAFDSLSCPAPFFETETKRLHFSNEKEKWIKAEFSGEATGLWGASLKAVLRSESQSKERSFRLYLPINREGETARCSFWFRLDEGFEDAIFSISLQSDYSCAVRDAALKVYVF
jgi:hypothetical protein